MTLYEELEWRGLIQDISSKDLIDKLNAGGMTFYIGTDPTADSLHLGHYSSFLITRRLAKAGHTPIILVGAATGLIGDPRGTTERALSDRDTVFKNYEALKAQVQKFFPYEVVNNYDWVKDIHIIDFFRDYGKYINVNYMLNKDLVRRQMETGISYAEFSYMLIQGLDFKWLHEHKGVDLQVAGSDQWGNITTGIELIRKTTGEEVYAMTMPLVTDANGNKFGKSEGNAVWIDKNKTSSYELYQFLLNSEDAVVIDYLKKLTFLDRETIEQIEKEHFAAPEKRMAQKRLAKEILDDLHGEGAFEEAEKISELMFKGDVKHIPVRDLLSALSQVPHFEAKKGKLIDILVEAKVFPSKREVREMAKNNALTVNGDIVTAPDETDVDSDNLIDGKYLIVRRGKKKYFVGEIK
jgi:tyrosyl-tRNA synthetase